MMFRLLILVHVCAAFPLKCPEPAQWSLRARGHCPDPSKYFCLKDDLINRYSENCTVFDFLQPGRKHVLRGGLDADICSPERYQPWPILFYTNVSTDCIFLKSACNEIGLVVYDNGNRSTDITCRCDYTRGYDFIVKPRNRCFCIPSEEDCSCYLKMCQDSRYTLSPDYGCIHSKKNISINQCKPIFYERINRETNQSDFDDILRIRNISTAEKYLTTVAILVTSISLAVLFLSYPLAKFLANCYIEHNFFSKALSIEPAEEVIEGNDISISCEIIQKNMGGTWYKNKSPLISTTRLASDINEKKHTLKIRNAELSDSAVYCIDFNGVKREIQLQVEGFFSKELSIDPEEVIEGKDVSISCEIIQKDMGGTWYKNGSPLSSTDRIECGINEKLNILTIHNAELSDSAVYSIYFKGVKRQTQLHVEEYFSKALSIDPAKPIEGNNVSISCEINQIGVVGIWYKNGSPVSSTDRIKCDINEKLHTLKIKNAELSDSAVYIIDFNGVKRQTQLHVEEYFSKALSIDPAKPIEGNNVSISCEINQIGVVGIWYKNGSPVSSTDRIKCDINEKLHTLKIKNAELSDSAVYIIDFNGVKRQTQLYVEVLPEAINQLSEEDKIRFYKLTQTSKTENRYSLNIKIVGKQSAGKTCLLRRLLKENINDVSCTDGIDIAIHRCKINIENGKWTFGKEIHDDRVDRIQRALVTNDKDSDTKNMQVRGTNNRNVRYGDVTSAFKKDLTTEKSVDLEENEDKNETSSMVMAEYFTTDAKLNLDQNNEWNESSSFVMPADLMSHLFSRSTVNTLSNPYALCGLWDFAGQREFYATHQAFLTSNAVYLVVADMKDDIIKQDLSQCFEDYQYIGGYVDFWFDSIHCHRTVNERASKGHFDPPILLVFTGKDKYNKIEFEKREKELNDQIEHAFRYKSKHSHLHERFFLSNIEDVDDEFEKLRYAVFENAEKMDMWGKSFPLKWIILEHLIEINKKDGKNFITFTGMLNLAKHPDINIIKEDDLLLFLRFQHNVGNIIFFENIRDLIILKPQWLADAFRCLVSDRIDGRRLRHLQDWTLLKQQGKISESLITELFESKCGSQFAGQKVNLHKVMEKLDILVKIPNSSYYIMPSMMPSSTFDVVCKTFGILSKNCHRSSWICLKFVFLPPSFFNYLSASFLRNYYPSQVNNVIALYRGICMFDIDSSGCKKILVTMSTDTIALQVVSFSTEQQEGFGSTCSDIYSEVKQFIEEMIKRYMVKISYKLHFKCSDGYYHKDTFAFENLTRDQKCFCVQHTKYHRSEKLYSPWIKNEVKRSLHDRMKTSTKKVDLNPSGEATAGQ